VCGSTILTVKKPKLFTAIPRQIRTVLASNCTLFIEYIDLVAFSLNETMWLLGKEAGIRIIPFPTNSSVIEQKS
jgi:hypothetical protein